MWKRWIRELTRNRGVRTRGELDEEMEFHLEALTRDLMEEGYSPAEARREALRRFGNPERVQERTREALGLGWLDELSRNFRFAFRGLRRAPAFSAAFVLTLGLTVALGITGLAVAEATLWRPLPYPDAHQLYRVQLEDPAVGPASAQTALDGAMWERVRDESGPLSTVVFTAWASGVNLSTEGAAAYVQQQRVGAGYFALLGMPPTLGREFQAAEDVPEGPDLVILSHALWRDTFEGDPEILGSTVRLKGSLHTVVGIAAAGFTSPYEADLWTPLRPSTTGEGGGTNYAVFARAPEGMAPPEVSDRLGAIQLPESLLNRSGNWRYAAEPLGQAVTRAARIPVLVLLGGVGLMILVGWANLTGLQLTRALRREPELATRRALGGDRGALTRQLLTENLLLAASGGLLGLGAALAARPWLEVLVQDRLGTWQGLPGPGTFAWLALALTGIAVAAYSAAPVVRVSVPGLALRVVSGVRVHGRRRHLARSGIVVAQLAMVTVLLFSAGVLGRSYLRLAQLDPGFEPEGRTAIRYSLDDASFADAQEVRSLFAETLDAMRALPGVENAAVALSLPYERPLNLVARLPGSEENLLTNVVYVTPGFFEVMEIPVLRGRGLSDLDRSGDAPVIVVNEAFVERYLPTQDPLASELQLSAYLGTREIVGVVGNVQQAVGWGGDGAPVSETPTAYASAYQLPSAFFQGMHIWFSPSWIASGSRVRPPSGAALQRVVAGVAPDLPVARVTTLSAVVASAFARQRFQAGLLLAVTLFGVLLSAIGVYGVIAQEVEERRGEMGVRMAMGATPGNAVANAAGGGLRMAAYGLLAGLVASWFGAGVLESLIWGVPAWDLPSAAAVALVLIAISALASFLPASRIGRLDPARVLRE